MRSDWTALPDAVVDGIADRVGRPFDVVPAPSGNHAEIAATVSGPGTAVFVKAASAGVRSLRYELTATLAAAKVTDTAPMVRWHFEAAGWLVMGAELLHGPHPDLSPGAADLGLLTAALKGLQETPALGEPWFTPAARLGWSHPAMDGTMLVHSDLNPTNMIVTADGLRIVDWAWATRAAPWVELALLVQWLIGSDHTAGQAEEWLSQFPVWEATGPDVLDDFAVRNAAKWSAKARQHPDRWVHDLADWTGEWAIFRRDFMFARAHGRHRSLLRHHPARRASGSSPARS